MLSNAITNGKLLPSTSLSLKKIQLVRCLTYISHRYFSSGRSLVISSPATYRDVQQELIAEIHRLSIWPVVVTVDGNISIPEKSDFIDIDGNYIILIPDGNIKNFKVENNGLVQETFEYTRLWILKLSLLWLEQMNSQCRNKLTYLNISKKLEYITALS